MRPDFDCKRTQPLEKSFDLKIQPNGLGRLLDSITKQIKKLRLCSVLSTQ